MPSRTDRMCLSKKRFTTEVTAQAFARNFAGASGLTPQRAYRCPHCFGWHLATVKVAQHTTATPEEQP